MMASDFEGFGEGGGLKRKFSDAFNETSSERTQDIDGCAESDGGTLGLGPSTAEKRTAGTAVAATSNPYTRCFAEATNNPKIRIWALTAQGGQLARILESIRELLIEVELTFQPEGMSITASLPMQAAHINLQLSREWFDYYVVKEPVVRLGIKTTLLANWLRLGAPGLCEFMQTEADVNHHLNVNLHLQETGRVFYWKMTTFKVNSDEDHGRMPDAKICRMAFTSSNLFQSQLRFFRNNASEITIECDDYSLLFVCVGIHGRMANQMRQDGNAVSFKLPEVEINSVHYGGESGGGRAGVPFLTSAEGAGDTHRTRDGAAVIGKYSRRFNIRLLHIFAKSANINKRIELCFYDNGYIALVFRIGDAGYIRYLIPPLQSDANENSMAHEGDVGFENSGSYGVEDTNEESQGENIQQSTLLFDVGDNAPLNPALVCEYEPEGEPEADDRAASVADPTEMYTSIGDLFGGIGM